MLIAATSLARSFLKRLNKANLLMSRPYLARGFVSQGGRVDGGDRRRGGSPTTPYHRTTCKGSLIFLTCHAFETWVSRQSPLLVEGINLDTFILDNFDSLHP